MPPGPPFQVIFFDCDSTLSAVEGIDELARRAGVVNDIAPLTHAAMEGRIALEEVYRHRLGLICPDRNAIEWLGDRYLAGLVEGSREVVAALHALGKQVHIISGGIRQAVLRVGRALDVPDARVHAVNLSFDDTGAYLGFDETSPLTRSGGKVILCQQVLAEGKSAALVGDGITDLEVASVGVFVVGFGGVARREAMVRDAHAYVDRPSLLTVLDVVLAPEERGLRNGMQTALSEN
jgi:phosphoserine phosphatase